MCRSDVPAEYLEKPHLLNEAQLEREMAQSEGYQWFYEGRNGWWKYDERTSAELETSFSAGQKRAELLVAGYRYVVDFEAMLQLRRSDPARRRRVKRDTAAAPKKGVAGIRLGGVAPAVVVAPAGGVAPAPAGVVAPASPGGRRGDTAAVEVALEALEALGRLAVGEDDEDADGSALQLDSEEEAL